MSIINSLSPGFQGLEAPAYSRDVELGEDLNVVGRGQRREGRRPGLESRGFVAGGSMALRVWLERVQWIQGIGWKEFNGSAWGLEVWVWRVHWLAHPAPECAYLQRAPPLSVLLSSEYRGTSLIRNTHLLGPYSRTIPRVLWWA